MTTFSELDKRILSDIEMYGWHVIKVPEDELGTSFGYTVGLYHSFEHPEILIVGLALETIHFLLNKVGENIRDGLFVQPGHFYSNIIESLDCYFTLVDPKYYEEYSSYNQWYYKEKEYTLLQCIYPNINGIYPWQKDWKGQQPILGDLPY